MIIDYSEHFWGDKHIGYNVLYENLKKGEDTVQEFSTFVKERISLEEDLHKYLNKSLVRINQYIANNGPFVESWRLTKGTLELYCEIQTSVLKNLLDLSKDVIKYHDDLVKSRKRVKEQDVIDAVNLMQTTTTCLQKAKETYQHRCNELLSMKNEAPTKDIAKAKAKVIKAHEEYKSYVEKYGIVRDNFEEKLIKAAKAFQAHDIAHLQQMKNFFVQLSKNMDDSHGAISQVTGDYKNNLQQIDLENIMLKFVEEKGTGNEKPEPIKWTDNDELIDFDVISHIAGSQSAPSSSNSSAIVTGMTENSSQIVSNLVDLDSPTWTLTTNSQDLNNKSPGDSDADTNQNLGNSGYVQQLSSSIGRQKLSQWLPRRKKNASQSSLPSNDDPSGFGESASKGGFLRRYRKSKNELTITNETEDNKSVTSSGKSGDEKMSNFGASGHGFGDSELTPTVSNAPVVDEDGFVIRPPDKKEKHQWSSTTSSSDEDENEFQTSKIRQLQIKPINSSNSQMNASVDELRNAIGHISLQRSTTFDKDPWSNIGGDFSQSLNSGKPLRTAYTGDENLRRKTSTDIDFTFGFSQSVGGNCGSTIARARPRSNTPTVSGFGLNSSISGINTVVSDSRRESISNDLFFNAKNETNSENVGFSDSFSNFSIPKHPIAMAINEFVHVWFKKDIYNPEVKVFGTIVISFPAVLLKILTNLTPELKSIKFLIENGSNIQKIMPNKRFVLPSPLPQCPSESYYFTIDKLALANWLLDQEKEKPNFNFYNMDIVRYELNQGYSAPLIFKSYWKINENETGIRIDYELNENNLINKALLNICFTTKVNGEPELYNSDPEAKFDKDTGILSWNVTELTPHGEKNGSLKARLKLNNGPSTPENTFVQFQMADMNMSDLSLKMDPESGYNLSMTKRKLIAGKYFCEPEVRN